MKDAHENRNECRRIEELIVWYPAGTLDDDEKRMVEEHLARCPACAESLSIAAGLRDLLVEGYSPHPSPGSLVAYTEGETSIDTRRREEIRRHLALCEDCSGQVSILEAVERDLSAAESPQPIRAGRLEDENAGGTRSRSSIAAVLSFLFRPVPAALYLAVALTAVGILVLRSDRFEGSAGPSRADRSGRVPGGAAGITILADETASMRGLRTGSAPVPAIGPDSLRYLMLELTDLESPPEPGAVYALMIVDDDDRMVVGDSITGAMFADTYTICLPVDAYLLSPGRYLVLVTDPAGRTIFRSSFDISPALR